MLLRLGVTPATTPTSFFEAPLAAWIHLTTEYEDESWAYGDTLQRLTMAFQQGMSCLPWLDSAYGPLTDELSR